LNKNKSYHRLKESSNDKQHKLVGSCERCVNVKIKTNNPIQKYIFWCRVLEKNCFENKL